MRITSKTPLEVAAHALLEERLAKLTEAAGNARALGVEAVHDVRVASRRFRVALALLGKKALRAHGDDVAALQRSLGELRDAQLRREWVRAHGGEVRQVDAEIREARERARVALVVWDDASLPALLADLGRVHRKGTLGGKRMRRALKRKAKKVRSAARAAKGLKPKPAHRLRIAARKLRYATELLAPALGGDESIEALSELQTALGELHDADVRAERFAGDAVLVKVAREERKEAAKEARKRIAKVMRWI